MQGCKHSKGMSKSEMGLWKPWSGYPGMGMERGSENRIKVLRIEWVLSKSLGMNSGHGEVWIGVPVRCYMECNNPLEQGQEIFLCLGYTEVLHWL